MPPLSSQIDAYEQRYGKRLDSRGDAEDELEKYRELRAGMVGTLYVPIVEEQIEALELMVAEWRSAPSIMRDNDRWVDWCLYHFHRPA